MFKSADQAYPDLPRCGECDRPMRPIGSKAADWPGTINRITVKLCGSCYARERYREKAAAKRAEQAKAETIAPAAPVQAAEPGPDLSDVLVAPPKLVLPDAPSPKPAPKETPSVWAQNVRQLGEKREREKQQRRQATQQAKYAALHAEAEAQANTARVDEEKRREQETQAGYEAFLAGRRQRQATAAGVRMPGEAEGKPYAGNS